MGQRGRKPYTYAQMVESFWSRTDKNGPLPSQACINDGCPNTPCWVWTGSCSPNGYGRFAIRGKQYQAHRVALAIAGTEVAGLFALHKCDNSACVNPEHLYAGTPSDNQFDRGRRNPESYPRGERHGSHTHPESRRRGESSGTAKLTEQDVRKIMKMWDGGSVQEEIAEEIGISLHAVADVVQGISWVHVTGGRLARRVGRKLTEEKVRGIVEMAQYCRIYTQIAREFDVDRKTVRDILSGRLCSQITGIQQKK